MAEILSFLFKIADIDVYVPHQMKNSLDKRKFMMYLYTCVEGFFDIIMYLNSRCVVFFDTPRVFDF